MAVPRQLLFVAVPLVVLSLAGAGWGLSSLHRGRDVQDLKLFGNVDLRQVDLAFNNSERIVEVNVQEGDLVRAGQVLARLDTGRLRPQADEAAAQVAAQRQVLERLRHGSRPEEIAEARANVESARADAARADQQYARMKRLFDSSSGRAASQQDLDNDRSTLDVAKAKVVLNEKALALAIAGPRSEDVRQAEAQLQADEARLQLLRQQLADSELIAPAAAAVRSRLMEPGEIASPQRPVFSLAIVNPKWVRAYVPEPDLGKIHPGMVARVSADSFPGQSFEGWVGFVSPVAEFTPRTVQTTELRTSLVYEVRVFVKDAQDRLRLGMPASVNLPLSPAKTAANRSDTPAAPATQPAPSAISRATSG